MAGWAGYLAITADPWPAILVITLSCAVAAKIVSVFRAARAARASGEPLPFDVPAWLVMLDRDHDEWRTPHVHDRPHS
ncbi:hypothetical protein ACWEJ6_49470 [Nonomuraea sp. NPDC004702]